MIDLRDDALAVRRMLEKAVRRYAPLRAQRRSAKRYLLLTRIDMIYSLGDTQASPWISLCLDTSADAEPGDDYTHANFAMLKRKHWLPAVKAVCEGRKADLVATDGKSQKVGDAALGRAIGKFLVASLLAAREDGVFSSLPLAKRCMLGVEDPTTGEFGWPSYKDRGKDNLAELSAAPARGRKEPALGSKPSRRSGRVARPCPASTRRSSLPDSRDQ